MRTQLARYSVILMLLWPITPIAQTFTAAPINLPSLNHAKVFGGEFNNDRLKDVFVAGVLESGESIVSVLVGRNDGGFDEIRISNLRQISFAFADYNKDSFTDILLTGLRDDGEPETQLWESLQGKAFKKVAHHISNLSNGGVLWCDVDHDADLDIVISGIDSDGEIQTMVFEYKPGARYERIAVNLPGVMFGQVVAFDANNDNIIELVLTGMNEGGFPVMKVFTIDPSFGVQLYTDDLPGTAHNSVSVTDLDADGYNDMIITGLGGDSFAAKTLLLRNNQFNGFTVIQSDLPDLIASSVDAADIDGDGLSDIVLTGQGSDGDLFASIFRNEGAFEFIESNTVLAGIMNGDCSIVDFDYDGDNDILLVGQSETQLDSRIYRANSGTGIIALSPPSNLTVIVDDTRAHFEWDAVEGKAFRYNLYLSRAAGGSQLVLSPNSAIPSGDQRASTLGYQFTKDVSLTLEEGEYFAAVQTIDAAGRSSLFSEELRFSICLSPATKLHSKCLLDSLPLQIDKAHAQVDWSSTSGSLNISDTSQIMFRVTGPDTVVAKVQNLLGCIYYDTTVVRPLELPKIEANESIICEGQSLNIALTANNLQSADWYSGQTLISSNTLSLQIDSPQSGWLTVKLMGHNHCSNWDSLSVRLLPLPSVTEIEDLEICEHDSVTVTMQGNWSTIAWISDMKGEIASNVSTISEMWDASDHVNIQVTDENGCMATETFNVLVNKLPTLSLTSASSAACANSRVAIEVETNASTVRVRDSGSMVDLVDGKYEFDIKKPVFVDATAESSFGCVVTSSIQIAIEELPEIELGPDVSLCPTEHVLLKTSQNYPKVIWSNHGFVIGSDWFIDYSPERKTTILCSVTNSAGCTNADSIVVSVLEAPLFSALSDTSVCKDDLVVLGYHGDVDVDWRSSEGYLLGIDGFLAMNPTASSNIIAEITSRDGCSATDSIFITVLPIPKFEIGPEMFVCLGDEVEVVSPIQDNVIFDWWLNDQQISSGDLLKFIPSERTRVFLSVKNMQGCSYSDSLIVSVDPKPDVEISGDTTICRNEAAHFSLSTPTWEQIVWRIGPETTFTQVSEIMLTPSSTTVVSVSLKDHNGCENSDSVVLVIFPLPLVSAGSDALICFDEVAQVGEASACAGCEFTWTPAVGLTDAHSSETNARPELSMSYTVTVVDTNGCSASDSVWIEVNPELSITPGLYTSVCLGDSLQLGGAPTASGSNFPYQFTWFEGDVLLPSTDANPIVKPDGSAWYKVWVNTGHCPLQEDSIFVTVNGLPVVNAGEDVAIGPGEGIYLNAAGAKHYQWSPSEFLDNPFLQSPLADPLRTTVYTVRGTDENACVGSDTIVVIVQNNLFIPSMFSPNSDSMNDVFLLYGSGIKNIDFTVFDLTGNLVFHSNDRGMLFEQGWAGSHQGQMLSEGVYVWRISGSFFNDEPLLFEGKNHGLLSLKK